ncbi:hypothetical protein QTJ16_003083 [Diplocarpon rosae]|uniref:MYND-type domain-containing protein n=1 Tax=Diplocarpon rosae TaxID=946125 RepID=A0AAD9T0Z1_9HELO|nr:hypothetical protein QTJ16_003083 [Diplocarpon rosae]
MSAAAPNRARVRGGSSLRGGSSTYSRSYFLLGTIAENMTVSTSPTFILKDRSSTSFALTLKVPADRVQAGVPGGGFDVRAFRKGFTVVVPRAKRSGVKEGKAGFVQTPSGSVQIIPASVEKLLAMSEQAHDRAEAVGPKGWCQGCREVREWEALSRCRGCESVWYCNKECQAQGWSEQGHRSECKVFQAVSQVFPKE